MTTHALSLRAFGRALGVSDATIRKAIKSGRISPGVVGLNRSGRRPVILDPERARREFEANRAGPAPERRSDVVTMQTPSAAPIVAQRAPVAADGPTLAEANRRLALERERRLRLENDELEGRLVPAADVARVQTALVVAARARLLAVHHQAVMQGLPVEHAPLVRDLIHQALAELADVRTLHSLEALEARAS